MLGDFVAPEYADSRTGASVLPAITAGRRTGARVARVARELGHIQLQTRTWNRPLRGK